MVRALFMVATYRQPSVVFIDEVDSLLCQRSSDENEASRRMKTEFLIQLDGAGTAADVRVVIVGKRAIKKERKLIDISPCQLRFFPRLGATNRPEELDEAARRRFVKRIYIPLPDEAGRQQLFERLLNSTSTISSTPSMSPSDSNRSVHALSNDNISELVRLTDGFSGADIRSLCTEAALGPVRELARGGNLEHIRASDVPLITMEHFEEAFDAVTTSVSQGDLQRYLDWNSTFGSFRKLSA